MKKTLQTLGMVLLILGLVVTFQNCSSSVPEGNTRSVAPGEEPIGSGSDLEVTQQIQPPSGVVDPADYDQPIQTRLDGFIARCADTNGEYVNAGNNVYLCRYTYPALQSGNDIARMIWAKFPEANNPYEPVGYDFRAEVHAELACKQIMGNNNVFPYAQIALTRGNSDSSYWDYQNEGWSLVTSPDDDSYDYYLLGEISCRFFNQEDPVGNNNINFN